MGLDAAGDRFMCRTLNSDAYNLREACLLAAVRELRPAVILDTLSRFSTARDENSASDNRQLSTEMFGLLAAGARAVVAIHHAVKGSAKEPRLTLETALRGTGDLAAIADAVWGLQCKGEQKLEIRLQCVKARDFEQPKPFHILGRPYINRRGDFVIEEELRSEGETSEVEKFAEYVSINPSATYRQIAAHTKIPPKRVREVAKRAGWKQNNKRWEQVPQGDAVESLFPVPLLGRRNRGTDNSCDEGEQLGNDPNFLSDSKIESPPVAKKES
jgi:hypothetical protein